MKYTKNGLIKMLKNGEIEKFNTIRKDTGYKSLNFSGVDFSGIDLSGVNLMNVNLSGANLRGVNLSDANFRNADLSYAELIGVYLRNTDLSHANLSNTIVLTILNIFQYPIYFVNKSKSMPNGYCQIGCEGHTHKEWEQSFEGKNEYLFFCNSPDEYWKIKKCFMKLVKGEI